MATCPTCGQQVHRPNETGVLLELLKHGQPHREVYVGRDGLWYVTYGGGPFSVQSVQELRRRGEIVSVYSNCPDDAYHVGRTIDMDRTLAARKMHGRKTPLVYVGEPAPVMANHCRET